MLGEWGRQVDRVKSLTLVKVIVVVDGGVVGERCRDESRQRRHTDGDRRLRSTLALRRKSQTSSRRLFIDLYRASINMSINIHRVFPKRPPFIFLLKKVNVAHTLLPSVGFRS